MRKFNRKNDQSREITIKVDINGNAHGSCIVSYGMTKIICTASIDDNIPRWLKDKKMGWVTAEYGMLPGSTNIRNKRESKAGKQSGRTVEIQRLIGRSLRSIVDLKKLYGFQVIVDCDVIQADGGTRTASISGGFVALNLALRKFVREGIIKKNPIKDSVVAISCGIINNKVLLDLDYNEDSCAQVDANFVISKKSGFSEIQISGEETTFNQSSVNEMIEKSKAAAEKIFIIQENAINKKDK